MGGESAGDEPGVMKKGRKRKRSLFGGDIMRIEIKDEGKPKTYSVHKELLCQESRYFAALSNFKEGQEALVSLEQTDQATFENVVHWLYKGVFDLQLPEDHAAKDLIKTWAAADRLMMNNCKNIAMDTLRRLNSKSRMEPVELLLVGQLGYSTDSTLARYIIDQLSYDSIRNNVFGESPSIAQALQDIPVDLVYALLGRIVETAKKWYVRAEDIYEEAPKPIDPASVSGCAYHDHVEGEDCHLKGQR